MPKTGRNDPCPCKSGLKYKHCHGDIVKEQLAKHAMNYRMAELIVEEKIKRGLICKHGVVEGEHCPSCKIGD